MNIVVFSPHPDDAEVLMGGTIARYIQKGHQVHIVLVTIPPPKNERLEESKKAASILGARLLALDLEPNELGFNRKTIEKFDEVLESMEPEIIYAPWVHDSHQDHVAVSKATVAAARKNVCSLYMYNQTIPSGLTPYGFNAQAFVDISDTFEIKIKSVMAHTSQLRKYGKRWIQGIKGRATYNGFCINADYAEAFEVVKDIKCF